MTQPADYDIVEAMCAAHWNAAKTIDWAEFMRRQPGSREYWHNAMRKALAAMRAAEYAALNPTEKAVEDRLRPPASTASGTPLPHDIQHAPRNADPPAQ